MELISKFPEIKIPNKFYRNKEIFSLKIWNVCLANDPSTFSNGAVYADFDNDGDLDIVVNNVNDAVLVV